MRAWKQTCSRQFEWTGKGRRAEEAVWVQSVQEEAMAQRGQVIASVLFDLVKACERVVLARVWERGEGDRGFHGIICS